MSRRLRVILNPEAGSKGAITTNAISADDVRAALAARGLGEDVLECRDEAAARAAVRQAVADGVDVVVAAGGDGTARLVAAELLRTPAALGILPLGSVMNMARMLGVPRDLDGAVEILATGEVRAIDVGEARGRPFFEAGSVGMNAAMFEEAQRFDDGDWLSILRTIWVAIRYRPARMTLRLDDGVVQTRALMVTVSNGPYFGAGMTVAPAARLDDGRFDVRVFRGFSKLELLRHLAGIAFGRYRYAPHVSTYRSRRVRIEAVSPLPARADSEALGTTPIEFVTLHAALRALGPGTDAGEASRGTTRGAATGAPDRG